MEGVECENIPEVVSKKETGGCGLSEMECRSKRAEERCQELELEIVKRRSEYEALEAKFRALEVEKLDVEEEIKALKEQGGSGEDEKRKYFQGEKRAERVGLMEDNWEEDKVCHLIIENKVLECEKKKAESEVEAWKENFKELESWMLKLDKNLVLKDREFPLAGRINLEHGALNVGSLEDSQTTQPNKRFKLEDGLHVKRGLECSRDQGVAVGLVDGGSACHSLGKGICNLLSAVTPANATPCKHNDGITEERNGASVEADMEYTNNRPARKQLKFEEEGSPSKKMAPSTPAGGLPSSLGVINISDSDDELNITCGHIVLPTDNEGSQKVCISSGSVLGETVGCESDVTTNSCMEETQTDHNVEEDTDDNNEAFLLTSTPRRKRALSIVSSDSEGSDDNIPIRKLKKMHLQEIIQDQVGSDLNGNSGTATASVVDNATDSVTPPRRRLIRLRKSGAQRNCSSSETKNDEGILTNEDVEDNQLDGVGSESEGESLGGFIVHCSDNSESNDASAESDDSSDDNVNFDEILSKFQRKRDHKLKWELEADMLSAFGKDPELCMRAVCALYRQQTSEEKYIKGSLCYNHRGFSKFDALKGSTLAEFLTAGDPNGDLVVTVDELEEYDPRGIETCRTFASRYSKQLFEIYKNKEDTLFLPS